MGRRDEGFVKFIRFIKFIRFMDVAGAFLTAAWAAGQGKVL